MLLCSLFNCVPFQACSSSDRSGVAQTEEGGVFPMYRRDNDGCLGRNEEDKPKILLLELNPLLRDVSVTCCARPPTTQL